MTQIVKSDFRRLTRQAEKMLAERGPAACYVAAFRLARLMADSRTVPAETTMALLDAAEHAPAPWRRAIEAAGLGSPEESGIFAAAALLEGVEPWSGLGRLIQSGPDAGHPIWHALNPLYHVWRDAWPGDPAKVPGAWASNSAVTRGRSDQELIEGARKWAVEHEDCPALHRLQTLIAHRSLKTILDFGCGYGEMATWLEGQYPGLDIFACDALPARVDATRRCLDLAGLGNADDVYQCGATPWREILPTPPIDVVTMFRVTGCMDDEHLRRLLEQFRDADVRWIFETNVPDSWDMWIGRKVAEAEPIFARAGWALADHAFYAETLTPARLRDMILPAKSWPAAEWRVWRRA